jgi:hypothetical protein
VSYPQLLIVKAKVEYDRRIDGIKITGTAENLTGIVQSMYFYQL